jgi:aspartyl-tRNA(Asn)/glutamyl-tRNA(Gln) amidotransferase subunit A
LTPDQIAFADAGTLQGLLRSKSVSSVELTKLYIDRLERYGPIYGAVVTVLHERGLREARRADRERSRGMVRGPLHGIPYGVKDLLATPDAPTTWGAAPFRQQRFDYDATVVARLSAAGAVLIAKLAMVELAGGFGYNDADASFTGPGRTPWDWHYWSGGSSSGSGAAVSAGLVGFAIGSETSGSILNPSASCGVTGLRPTYGRVSRHGAMALCWTLDKLGPIARSARDAQTVLGAIAGADPRDPTAVDRPLTTPRRRPRIAVVAGATKKTMPGVVKNFNASVKVLAEFCDVETGVALPAHPYGVAVGAIVNGEGAAAFRELIESGKSRLLQQRDDRLGGYAAYSTLAVDYIDAQRRRTFMIADMHAAFGTYDAIVSPTLSTVALPVGVPFDTVYTAFDGGPDLISSGNLAGLPALTLPNGLAESGLPSGLALLGKAFGEPMLTAIGKQFQARTAHHQRHPVLLDRPPNS